MFVSAFACVCQGLSAFVYVCPPLLTPPLCVPLMDNNILSFNCLGADSISELAQVLPALLGALFYKFCHCQASSSNLA